MKAIRFSAEQYLAHQQKRRGVLLPFGPSVAKTAPGNTVERGTPEPVTGPNKRGMNGLETRYAQHLELQKYAGEIVWWAFERLRLRIGAGAWFKPDFCVQRQPCGALELHETKGFRREAAIVRIKSAADQYPFKFYLVTEEGGQWKKTKV